MNIGSFTLYNTGFYFLLAMLVPLACRNKLNDIQLIQTKEEGSQHLGYGVWILVPDGYQRAKTYSGFQSEDGRSSIHVEINPASFDELKISFEPKKLKEQRTTLIQMRGVNYNHNTRAFFATVEDERKKTIRYLLAIDQNDTVYAIQAFCYKSFFEEYNLKIKGALFSVFIGEFQEKTELFLLANLVELNHLIFTRDGLYPTKSTDQSEVEIKILPQSNKVPTEELIQLSLAKYTTETEHHIYRSRLTNGQMSLAKLTYDSGNVLVAIIEVRNGEGYMINCKGNPRSSLEDFETFINRYFIDTKIGYRN